MKREYVMRGKRVEIDEIDGIVAVKPVADGAAVADLYARLGERAAAPVLPMNRNGRDSPEPAGPSCIPHPTWPGSSNRALPYQALRPYNACFATLPDASFSAATGYRSGSEPINRGRRRSCAPRPGPGSAQSVEVCSEPLRSPSSAGQDFLEASVELSANPDFEYAEPQFIEHIPGRLVPTDPEYNQQWHLNNTGQNGGAAGADISAEDAWDMNRGAGVRLRWSTTVST